MKSLDPLYLGDIEGCRQVGLPITPEVLRGAYKFLCATEPFVRWNLPDDDDITFKVVTTLRLYGWFRVKAGKRTIAISSARHHHTATMLMTMAHEMIHVYEEESSFGREDVQHSAAFKKLALLVCKYHGFDPGIF